MRIGTRQAAVAVASVSLIIAAAVPVLAQSPAPGMEDYSGMPQTGTLHDGSTFTLKPEIAAKIAAGEPINYLFSYQSSSIPLFSPQYQAGYAAGLEEAQTIYAPGVVGQIVAPAAATGDVNEQVAQIQAQIGAGQVDCLSIQPATSDGFTKIVNDTMAAGIPVFTVGVTSNGNELTNFTQIPLKEGAQAAQIVLDWEAETGNDLKVFALSGGDPTQFWAQGRMKGFQDTIMAADPEATFVNDAANGLLTSYDPAQTYSTYQALIQGNPELQFIENVDIGAEHANKAIIDAGKEGQIFTIGWNVSLGQLDGIDKGIQVAALDQRWAEQAGFGARACASLFANSEVLANTQELLPVTKENSAAAREDLNAILGG